MRIAVRGEEDVSRPTALKMALLCGALLLIGLFAAFSNRSPTLSHLRVGVLPAGTSGNDRESGPSVRLRYW
jgi:hypothetical protein